MREHILKYSGVVGVLYVALVLATWLIFGNEDITIANAFKGTVVYLFYLVIVFGAFVLGSVVAYMLKREHEAAERDALQHR